MFTGIIETIGKVAKVGKEKEGLRLFIHSALPTAKIKIGDSICVDGCCLTVTKLSKKGFETFLSHETLARTTFGKLNVGAELNLERSLTLAKRLDGHLVQGHVEAVGILQKKEKQGESLEISVGVPDALRALVIPKGSIAVDGISLTVNWLRDEPKEVVIGINLIPHTLASTTLGLKGEGEGVHLESDVLGRYALRVLEIYRHLGK